MTIEVTTAQTVVEVTQDGTTVEISPPASYTVEITAPGPQGIPGPQGEPGDPAATIYVHDQATASSTWTIEHGTGYFLNITVVDSAGSQVEGSVAYQDANTIVVEFAAPFAGKAFLS